jgi:hypothetical protein
MAEMQSNRNDDVFGRTDKQFGIPSIDSLALKYSKAQLQQMAQMGRIPPIYAVMAGMAQDRIQLNNSHAPETTVAQDTLGQQVTDSSGQGITDSSGAAVGAGERVAPQSTADISKAYGGLMSIPRPGEKYNQDNFATGGIVAFTKGGKAEDEAWEKYKAAHEKARGPKYGDKPIYDSQVPFFGSLPGIIGNPEIPHDAVSNPEAPVVAAPTSTVDVETQKQLAKVQPAAAPTGPLAAMAQKEEPEMGLQQIMQQLPKRTPADTTGLVDTPETIAKNKDDLMYRAVGYTGAEMMAGKSPFALVNIGEALSKGFSSYAQQIEAHKKTTKDDIKDLAAIKRAEQALEQNDLKMGVDIMTNELNNKSAMKRMEMQVKGSLEGARIGAGSKPLDIPHILMYGSPEEKERARGVVSMMNTGKDKTPQEVRIAASTLLGKNDEYAMLSTSDKPAERARAAKMLSDIEAYIRTGDMGGGGGKGEVNKSNPLLTGK